MALPDIPRLYTALAEWLAVVLYAQSADDVLVHEELLACWLLLEDRQQVEDIQGVADGHDDAVDQQQGHGGGTILSHEHVTHLLSQNLNLPFRFLRW